jgi:hypothetical protein
MVKVRVSRMDAWIMRYHWEATYYQKEDDWWGKRNYGFTYTLKGAINASTRAARQFEKTAAIEGTVYTNIIKEA